MQYKDIILISIALTGFYWLIKSRKSESEDDDKIDESWLTPPDRYMPAEITMTTSEASVMRFKEIIMKEGISQKIDPAIIAGVIFCESKGNPNTKTYEIKVLNYSYGLMQILPGTARDMGLTGDLSLLYNPEVNIHLGTKYLAYQLDRYIDMYLTGKQSGYNPGHFLQDMISAYNAGHSTYSASSGLYSNHDYVYCVVTATYRFRKLFNNAYPGYLNLFPTEVWMI